MIVFVDIDETICTKCKNLDYATAKPIKKNIKKINKLYDQGDLIIYWTARGSITGHDWTELTKKQLEKWGAKYHELRFGKPFYDLLIEDKSKRIEEL